MTKRWLKRLGALLGVVVLAAGVYLLQLNMRGNFHEVLAGELYRSGQPTANQIISYSENYGIKTVLNLRGKSDKPWYQEESAQTARLGIKQIDFAMSAGEELTMAKSWELIRIMRDAPKPMLVHCKNGADRTGLAMVMYLQQISGIDEDEAEKQLSVFYGHVGIPYLSSTFAMDETWETMEKILGLDS